MRLVFVTQTLDADHPALAQTLDLVDALARRVRVGRRLLRLGASSRAARQRAVRDFGARTRLGRGAGSRAPLAGRCCRAEATGAVLAHMVPLFVAPRGPAGEAAADPARLWYTHWHAGGRCGCDAARRRRPQRRPALVPARDLEGARHRPCDRRRPLRAPEEAGRGPAPAPRAGPDARWKGYDTMLAALELATGRGSMPSSRSAARS